MRTTCNNCGKPINPQNSNFFHSTGFCFECEKPTSEPKSKTDEFYDKIKDDLRQIEEVKEKYPRIAEIVNFGLIVNRAKQEELKIQLADLLTKEYEFDFIMACITDNSNNVPLAIKIENVYNQIKELEK